MSAYACWTLHHSCWHQLHQATNNNSGSYLVFNKLTILHFTWQLVTYCFMIYSGHDSNTHTHTHIHTYKHTIMPLYCHPSYLRVEQFHCYVRFSFDYDNDQQHKMAMMKNNPAKQMNRSKPTNAESKPRYMWRVYMYSIGNTSQGQFCLHSRKADLRILNLWRTATDDSTKSLYSKNILW